MCLFLQDRMLHEGRDHTELGAMSPAAYLHGVQHTLNI